jgi:amidase
VEGHTNGCGNPTWLQTHLPADRTASFVQKLLNSGADLTGLVHMDELAYSLNGENAHYGTPVNHAAPDRVPGGSSSGSAVRCCCMFCSLCCMLDGARSSAAYYWIPCSPAEVHGISS